MNVKLSLIIPSYNEEKIIAANLTRILSYLKKQDYKWEVLVVDDGSRDRTAKIVGNFANRNVRLLGLPVNQGKGAAIRTGVLDAQGEFILFSDADLSVPLEFIEPFLAKLEEGSDMVIGSRRVKDSRIIKHQHPIREFLGRIFTILSRIVTFTNVTDFTCGFKAFTKKTGREIFSRAVVNRWVYDSEMIFLAKKFGYKIVEIPVDWINRKDSRVSLGSTVFTSFFDLLKIRLNDLLGKYA